MKAVNALIAPSLATLLYLLSPSQALAVDLGALSKAPVPSEPQRFDYGGFAKIAAAARGVQELEDSRLEERASSRSSYSSSNGNAGASDSGSGNKDTDRKVPATTTKTPSTTTTTKAPTPTPSAKRFSCKIYCNSASGPTIRREFVAANRKAAASQAEEAANSLCRQDGYKGSSSASFSESQCSEQ